MPQHHDAVLDTLRRAKQMGFSDHQLAVILNRHRPADQA
jgi:hypothetical protein